MAGIVQSLLQEVFRMVRLLYCSGLGYKYSSLFVGFLIFFSPFKFGLVSLLFVCLFVGLYICFCWFGVFFVILVCLLLFFFPWKQHLGVAMGRKRENTICYLVPIFPWVVDSISPVFHIMPYAIWYIILFKLELDIHNMTNVMTNISIQNIARL